MHSQESIQERIWSLPHLAFPLMEAVLPWGLGSPESRQKGPMSSWTWGPSTWKEPWRNIWGMGSGAVVIPQTSFVYRLGVATWKLSQKWAQGEVGSIGNTWPSWFTGQPSPGLGSQRCVAPRNRCGGREALPHTEQKSPLPLGTSLLGPGSNGPSDVWSPASCLPKKS